MKTSTERILTTHVGSIPRPESIRALLRARLGGQALDEAELAFKRVLHQRNESDALRAVAVMQQGMIVDLDVRLALSAARLSLEARLPMADSVVLATARLHDATLWTQDADFEGLPGVRYRSRKR